MIVLKLIIIDKPKKVVHTHNRCKRISNFQFNKKDMAFQQNVLEKKHSKCKRQKLQQSDRNSAHCNELRAFAKATSYSK